MAVLLRGGAEKLAPGGAWAALTVEVRRDASLAYYRDGEKSSRLDLGDVARVERKNSSTLVLYAKDGTFIQLRRGEGDDAVALDALEQLCRRGAANRAAAEKRGEATVPLEPSDARPPRSPAAPPRTPYGAVDSARKSASASFDRLFSRTTEAPAPRIESARRRRLATEALVPVWNPNRFKIPST